MPVLVNDADPDDAWSAVVDYGDGSGSQPVDVSGHTVTLHHTYAQDGTDELTLTVTDAAGLSAHLSVPVRIADAAPVLQTVNSDTRMLPSDRPVTLTGTFTDAGVTDTHIATFVLSGHHPIEVPATVAEVHGSGHATASTTLPPGRYLVSLRVTDDAGLTATPVSRATRLTVTPTPETAADLVAELSGLCHDHNVPPTLTSHLIDAVEQAGTAATQGSVTQARRALGSFSRLVATARRAHQVTPDDAQTLQAFRARARARALLALLG